MVRQLGLAVLVAAVSRGVDQLSFDSTWAYFECEPGSKWVLALLGGTVLLALARLRFPATTLVGAAALFALWPAAGALLALTAFRAAGHVRPERRLRISVALAVVVDLAVAVAGAHYGWTIVVAGHAVALLICIGLPFGVQVLLGKADRLVAVLRERAHYLEDNYRLAHSAARLQERSRIAQEMHDQLGHRLSLISLYAGALELATTGTEPTLSETDGAHRGGAGTVGTGSVGTGTVGTGSVGTGSVGTGSVGTGSVGNGTGGNGTGEYRLAGYGNAARTPAGADEARLIRGTVHAAMRELRATLGMLRSVDPGEPLLQPLAQTGTKTDLAMLVAESRSAGVPVVLTWDGDDLTDAPLPVRRAVHRLVREGLTNIHRHAPGAEATVVVERCLGRVRIEVTSSPPVPRVTAPRSAGTGLGLVGVQERVRLLGGAFAAGATAGGGFRVLATLPLDEPATPDRLPEQPLAAGPAPVPARRGSGVHRRTLDHRRGIAVVLTVGLVGVPALVSAVLNGASLVVPGTDPYEEQPAEPVRIGMTQADVRTIVGTDDPLARLAAKAVETPQPADSTCLYSLDWDDGENEVIVRHCFRVDRLVAVDEFPVRTLDQEPK
ncbi:histidine kinase [Actinoplanes sp. NPDC051346]|uniref:sensor histidine kinase n=1 Tax=Actinoplanes sp. NPDC051346 TaxID=3155048 RepID=UPI00341FDBCF